MSSKEITNKTERTDANKRRGNEDRLRQQRIKNDKCALWYDCVSLNWIKSSAKKQKYKRRNELKPMTRCHANHHQIQEAGKQRVHQLYKKRTQ